jgi:hypothetical protein
MPGNCSRSFCPRRDRTEASSEPPDAFPKPDGTAVLASFLACGWPACPHLPGVGLARLDAPAAPKGLPYDLCRQLRRDWDSAQRDDDPMGDEDRSQAEADSRLSRGCHRRVGLETLAPCDFGRQAPNCRKPLSISAFTRRALWTAHAFTHVNAMPLCWSCRLSKC